MNYLWIATHSPNHCTSTCFKAKTNSWSTPPPLHLVFGKSTSAGLPREMAGHPKRSKYWAPSIQKPLWFSTDWTPALAAGPWKAFIFIPPYGRPCTSMTHTLSCVSAICIQDIERHLNSVPAVVYGSLFSAQTLSRAKKGMFS